jgi:hypothetical protein
VMSFVKEFFNRLLCFALWRISHSCSGSAGPSI